MNNHTIFAVLQTKRVALLVRRGRRRILNDRDVLQAMATAGRRWASEQGPVCGIDSLTPPPYLVEVESLEFGVTGSSVSTDVMRVQGVAVLLGLQGSGLVNGLYMPAVATVVALYPSDGWPIVGGDPLAVVGQRGPYFAVVNEDRSRVSCSHSSTDRVTLLLYYLLSVSAVADFLCAAASVSVVL